MRTFAFVAALVSVAGMSGPARACEVAHVDAEAVLRQMPAYERVKAELEAHGRGLEKSLKDKERRVAEVYATTMRHAEAGALSPAQQEEAEKQLAKMQQELQETAARADQSLVQKEQELTAPLYATFDQALQAVAREKGYAYVVDAKLLLYSGGGCDATQAVKSRLGL